MGFRAGLIQYRVIDPNRSLKFTLGESDKFTILKITLENLKGLEVDLRKDGSHMNLLRL